MVEYFEDVETTEEHSGYFYSVGEALTIVILGSLCGLKNVCQIHQWASNGRVKEFLGENFGIAKIPCYYWLLCLLKLILPESLNRCFIEWVSSLLPVSKEGLTVSFDGKTVRSTGKMAKHKEALHIVSAHIAQFGMTFGQATVSSKSNEIPAVQELIRMLDLEGCMVVADALNCQKETAKAVIESKADYLLNVKDNHENLATDIANYVHDDDLRKGMDTERTLEKNRNRVESRTAFVNDDIEWLYGKEDWPGLSCIGAIHRQVTTAKGETSEWHYYISSRKLTAEELLTHARLEWSVETMHWLLDVRFDEDFCRIEDIHVQQNFNMARKIALNYVRRYKALSNAKLPLSKIMLNCLLDPSNLLLILNSVEN